ncbi:PREDICTED: transcription factor PIL1-like [Camelina sativa]|uniref:Transcription factor PIL1-like n=1 Tax=Camelina sativa TaxID=90675 RepID=A0ABM1Q6P8_CAMSA|nr:PREDICTED: transcription factor PIL1-like [Camelina sativa]
MELVCENGKILAKTRRPKNNGSFQNQRTQSLLDLYETEYYDGFKKNIKSLGDTKVVPVSEPQPQQDKENDEQINNNNNKKKITSSKTESERNVSKSHKRVESSTLIDDSAKGPTYVEVITAPPDEQSAAVGRSTSSSKFSQGSSRDRSLSSLKRKHGDIEEEESTYLISNNSDDESDDEKTQVHMRTRKPVTKKRKRSTEVHRLSERKRRDEFNKKMRALQDLLPNCYKDDKASLLDEAIKYMRTLQLQVQMMSMGNGLIRPPTMLPMGHYSHFMGLVGMHMGAAAATPVPQFLPMNVHGNGFPGINNSSSQMLSFLNHPTGLIPNSPIFSPLENCSQQFVVPSCVPQTQATPLTQFPKSASTSNLEDAMQFRGSNGYYRSLN